MDKSQEQAPYIQATQNFLANKRPAGRFIVPGHQGRAVDEGLAEVLKDIWIADIPQHTYGLDKGTDKNPLLEAEQLAAELYNSESVHFIVSGASQANQAAMMAVCKPNQTIAVQRNSHLSIEQGLILTGAKAVYIDPTFNTELMVPETVTAGQLQKTFDDHPDITAVFVVSPTYFGHTADIKALAKVCHANDAYLIIDQAWGAHFGFHDKVPQSATRLGADLVVMSSHKSIGALTAGAMLHVGNPDLVYAAKKAVGVLSTTSPSLPILLSLDGSRRNLAINGQKQLAKTLQARAAFETLIQGSNLKVIASDDPLKLVVNVGGDATKYAEQLANQHNMHVELAYGTCVMLLLGINQSQQSLETAAKQMLATTVPAKNAASELVLPKHFARPELTARETFYAQQSTVLLEQAEGLISAETIAAYPPGIPAVIAGQRLDKETIDYLVRLRNSGTVVYGAADLGLQSIHVVN